MAIRTHLSGRYANLRGSGMKLTRACFFGKYSIRGLFITTHVHFSLSPIPCLPLWLGHYSCPFPVQLQRRLPEQFRTWGPVQAQRGSSAAPERCSGAVPGGIQSCFRGRIQSSSGSEVQCCSRGDPEQIQRGARTAPEGWIQSGSRCGVQCRSRGWVQRTLLHGSSRRMPYHRVFQHRG